MFIFIINVLLFNFITFNSFTLDLSFNIIVIIFLLGINNINNDSFYIFKLNNNKAVNVITFYCFIKASLFVFFFINISIKNLNIININLYRNVMELIEFYIILSNRINNYVKFIYNGALLILIRLFLFFDFY